MSSIKLYKKLPILDPDQFNAWSIAVQSAFKYHKWSDYLLSPSVTSPESTTLAPEAPSTSTTSTTSTKCEATGRDLEIEITTRAYLIEAIPFQMYSKFHGCSYTYEIWNALN